MTGRPGVQAHRRVPRSGAIGNAGRAGPHDRIARDRRCAAPAAARAPHLAEAALCRCLQPPLLSLAQAQQPHDAQESDQQAPGAAHRRSPPTALGRRNRACLPGAGRAPAEEACARPTPPCLASARPAPRSALRAPASPADVRRRAPPSTRASGSLTPARPAHAPVSGPPGLQLARRKDAVLPGSGYPQSLRCPGPTLSGQPRPVPELTPAHSFLNTRKSSLVYVCAVLWPP